MISPPYENSDGTAQLALKLLIKICLIISIELLTLLPQPFHGLAFLRFHFDIEIDGDVDDILSQKRIIIREFLRRFSGRLPGFGFVNQDAVQSRSRIDTRDCDANALNDTTRDK